MIKKIRTVRKIFSGILALSMIVSNISAVNVFADDVVYSYISEDGEMVNINKTELENEHWNVSFFEDVSPSVYADFPMEIGKFVDDYANLKLTLTYLKKLGENDSAVLKIIDIFEDVEVAEYDVNDCMMYSDTLTANKDYALVLTETIDGEKKEYYKEVSVENISAEMPDYIEAAPEGCERTVLVGNIEDLKASERIDENGERYIDGTAKRYTKINAVDFVSYRNTLADDAIYRIFTKDEDGERYTGFISTYEGGSELGIYTPDIIVRTWESYMSPAVCKLPSGGITATLIKNATKINMKNYRDYSYTIKDTKSPIKVIAWQVPEGAQETQNRWKISGHSDQSVAMEIWTASSLTGTPTKCTTRNASKSVNITFIPDGYSNVEDGDYIFFVLYMPNKTLGHGMFGIEPVDEYPSGDVSGSAYTAYQNGGSDYMYSTEYTLYDSRDTDTFYINYTDTTATNFRATLTNSYTTIETGTCAPTEKVLEISYYTNQTSYFALTQDPDDVLTAPCNEEATKARARYEFQVHADMQAFVSIYDATETTKSSLYHLSYKEV